MARVSASEPENPAAVGSLTPDYLLPEEVAALLRVSPKSVYRWAKEDASMPVLRMGKGKGATVRFPRERLERWLREREQGRPPIRKLLLSPANPAPNKEAERA